MATIEFLGAASGTVTGSLSVLTDSHNRQVVVDAGMYQGAKEEQDRNYEPLGLDMQRVDAMAITHAHLDHVGRVAIAINEGPSGRRRRNDWREHPDRFGW